MGLLLRAGQLLLGAGIVGAVASSCYSAGAGTTPPLDRFYFPVGLAVSTDGTALYAVNSDFDLQFSGGTLQSYNLTHLRSDAIALIKANLVGGGLGDAGPPGGGGIPFLSPPACIDAGPSAMPPLGAPPGQACSPPVDSTNCWYFQESAIIGAFATDLQVSIAPLVPGSPQRLFMPVRGDTTLTWANLDPADPFAIQCGQAGGGAQCGHLGAGGGDHRCTDHAGRTADPHNSRQVSMPGEPFGMAQTDDGTAIVITSQTDTKTSLLTTGLGIPPSPGTTPQAGDPSIQFVLDGLPVGGDGVASVPHDPDAPVPPCGPNLGVPSSGQTPSSCVRPAFLETNHSTSEIDLLRYYSDDGSSLHRPFIQREAVFPLTSNAVGTDSRGIAIDPTPRIACKMVAPADPSARSACAQLPARVFFASRTPPALGIAEIGGTPVNGGMYNPDQLLLTGNQPLPPGPSKVYLAPIVNSAGAFEMRVFVVLFDSSQIAVYDPEQQQVEAYIDVGPGPFAMAFDPFQVPQTGTAPADPLTYVGEHRNVATLPGPTKNYRFAYVASFTQSYVQMIDLDNSGSGETFETVVFTFGQPKLPKGQ
jgi:hypothetical protein